VIAFHLSRTLTPSGFLGVDMFFVLSGYLITSIIWREIGTGAFRISTFYDRRIRRIVPALLALLVVTTIVACIILLPADLMGYGRSVIATLTFVANVYFWRDTDYFSRAAENKPLLHLWSLGVEEQFYILFPLLLWLLARYARRFAAPGVGLLVVVSLAADIMLRRAGGATPAFFLLPTRSWELGAGAILAVLPSTFGVRGAAAHVMAWVGATATLVGLFAPIPWPWMLPAAVPVVAGTALIIFAGRWATPAPNKALGLRPFVFFGWISYSLYLWHWPIIVFGQYYLVRPLNPVEVVLSVAAMVALAIASWRFVERPFRDKAMPIARVRWTAALGSVALAAVAVGLILTRGLPERLSAKAALINAAVDTHYRCPVSQLMPFGASRACVMVLPTRDPRDADLVLLGNSHAQMYAPAWTKIAVEHHATAVMVPINGCLPTVSVNLPGCIPPAKQNLESVLALPRAKTVILGLSWNVHDLVDARGNVLDNRNDVALAAGLDDLIGRLERAGKRVILIGPIAEPGYDVASDLSRALAFGHPVLPPASMPLDQFQRALGPIIDHFAARPDITFVRMDQIQCASGRCDYLIGGRSLFSDDNHLAASALPLFQSDFERAYAQKSDASGTEPKTPGPAVK
jgi:peptidoglycan/LPS O-acetylase OafA/YrhL